jgi:hypothetical protein
MRDPEAEPCSCRSLSPQDVLGLPIRRVLARMDPEPNSVAAGVAVVQLRTRHQMVVNVDLGEKFDVYVGRNPKYGPTIWGTGPRSGAERDVHSADRAVEAFRIDFLRLPHVMELARRQLSGKILSCHCAKRNWRPPCHAEFLAGFVSGKEPGSTVPPARTRRVRQE